MCCLGNDCLPSSQPITILLLAYNPCHHRSIELYWIQFKSSFYFVALSILKLKVNRDVSIFSCFYLYINSGLSVFSPNGRRFSFSNFNGRDFITRCGWSRDLKGDGIARSSDSPRQQCPSNCFSWKKVLSRAKLKRTSRSLWLSLDRCFRLEANQRQSALSARPRDNQPQLSDLPPNCHLRMRRFR